jgi:hypothetical protein
MAELMRNRPSGGSVLWALLAIPGLWPISGAVMQDYRERNWIGLATCIPGFAFILFVIGSTLWNWMTLPHEKDVH